MKAKKIISLFLCVVLIFACIPVNSFAEDIEITEPELWEETEAEYAEGQVLFLYTQTVEDRNGFCAGENVSVELADCGINSLKELPAQEVYDTRIKENSDGTFTKSSLFIGYTDLQAEECLEKISRLSSVSEESLNYYMHEDTAFSMPIEITNPTNNYNTYTKWWMEDSVHIPEAWQQHNTLGEDVVVAVIDSGVYVNNPEIADNIWEDENGHRGFNSETLTYDVTPATSHGGNVTGIVAATTGNNRSLIGVAPEAKIMPIKASQTPMQITVASVVAGINYAVANGANIITMSLSTSSNVSTVKTACQAAYNAGITVISSAGNSAKSSSQALVYPAAYDCVIGVMAYGSDNQLCSFSNYDTTGNYYNIAAPGYAILGLPMSEQVSGITGISGTSQAAPIVAGLAALYYSLYPDHTPAEFRNALINSSTDKVRSNSAVVTNATYYFPRVNALKLLGYYDEAAPVVEAVSGTPAVVDDSLDFIYGLEENYSSIDDYITVSDGDFEFIPTENGNGTGSILRVYNLSGEIYKDYEIVIFGDTDGDAVCDGMDCALLQYVLDGGAVPDCVLFASDVNFDWYVSHDDYDIIAGCGLKKDFVTQIR